MLFNAKFYISRNSRRKSILTTSLKVKLKTLVRQDRQRVEIVGFLKGTGVIDRFWRPVFKLVITGTYVQVNAGKAVNLFSIYENNSIQL